jgi:hypothetical protein
VRSTLARLGGVWLEVDVRRSRGWTLGIRRYILGFGVSYWCLIEFLDKYNAM